MPEENTVFDLDNNFGRGEKLPNSTAVLVLGIISIVGCVFYGIPGMVCGIIAIVLYKRDKVLFDSSPKRYDSSSFANLKAGYTCGIIGLSLSAIMLLVMIIYIIIIVGFFTTVAGAAASSSELNDVFKEAMEQSQNR